MAAEKFSISWWNTSLAPSATSRATAEERQHVFAMINRMCQSMDFIALGEVSEADIDAIRENCTLDGFLIESGIEESGRGSFDTCVIYRRSRTRLRKTTSIIGKKGSSTLRIAQQFDVMVGESSFHIFLSHWPSRMWCQENHADRHFLGMRLRSEVEEILNDETTNPHVILLGDYNDEPFSESLSGQLMATRDRNLVLQRKHLLYNPFWRKLSPSSMDNSGNTACGSYFYRSGKITQWHTFDQIIFSHAFIAAKEWRLNELACSIFDEPELLKAVTDRNRRFDHLPVMSEIEKVA